MRTDDIWEHVTLPWRLLVVLAISVAVIVLICGCGSWIGPCGCPFGTVCQPDSSQKQGFVCVPAPRFAADELAASELTEEGAE